jgi:MYXO-CTERM domain-containing protein
VRLAVLTTLILALPAIALADVAPVPSCSGENLECTVGALEQPGTECRACDIGDSGSTVCDTLFEDTDFRYECTQDVTGVEVEIWCDGPTSSGGCAVERGPGKPLIPAVLLLVVAAGAVVVRMRRLGR